MGEEVHVPTISDSFRGASYHVAEKVFSWPVDKLLDGRSRGRGSWQESGLKSYLTISSNAWIMEIESVGLYLQEGIIRRMLLGGENSRVSSTIPSVVERDLCSI